MSEFQVKTMNVSDVTATDEASDILNADAESVADNSIHEILNKLSPEELAAVNSFAEKIDIKSTQSILEYGSNAQNNISEFSDATLNNIRSKDIGEIGNMISGLVVELKEINFSEEPKKGIKGLFKKTSHSINTLKAQYDKVETNINGIVDKLEMHEVTLLKDIAMLDKMYEKNEEYQKELSMYILAGKIKLNEYRNVDLKNLQNQAQKSGTTEDAQAVNDFANLIGRFEKKIHDLELTRTISLQMAPQIRIIQNNDTAMSEKIHSSIVNTIPLWKNQMVLALSMQHSEQAIQAQSEVNEITNSLLLKNSELLHSGTVKIAKENERGIVDIETLKTTNQELIEILTEVQQIQAEGHQKRVQAEDELQKIESQLKDKLVEFVS